MWATGQDVSALRSIMTQKSTEDKAQWRLLGELSTNKDSKDLEIEVLRRIQETVVLPFIIGKVDAPKSAVPAVGHVEDYKDLLSKVKTPRKEVNTDQFIQHQMMKKDK